MFTCYFHGDDGRRLCEQFLTSSLDKVAIVIDPPFGGLANVLAAGLKGLWAIAKTGNPQMSTVNPLFFLETYCKACPQLKYTDWPQPDFERANFENEKCFYSTWSDHQ